MDHPPPAPRRPVDGPALAAMVALCATWGLQQVAIKVAAPDVVPVMQVAIRSALSAALVALLVAVRGGFARFLPGTAPAGLLAGLLFGLEFLLIAEGLRRTTAAHMAVFLYTAPVFTGLGLHLALPAERLSRRQWLGVALAFGGIAVAFTDGAASAGGGAARWGDALGVLAGAAWGATTVVVRASALSEAPPAQTLLWQLAAGFALQLGYAVATGQAARVAPTPLAVACLLYQGVVVSFASYLAWFWMLRRYLASRLAVFSFMTPLFGVSFGVLLLGERVDARFAAGAALVLAGIVVVSGLPRRRPATS